METQMLIPTSYYSHHSYHGMATASSNDCQWEPLAAPNSESYYQYVQPALEEPSEYFIGCIPHIYINNGGNGMSMYCCSSGPSLPESTSSITHLPHGSSYSGPSSPVEDSSCCLLDLYCNGGNSSSLPRSSSPLPTAILQKDYTCVQEKEEKNTIKVEVKKPAYRSYLPNRNLRKDRLSFNFEQLQKLEASFEHKKYLVPLERVMLARSLCVTTTQVKTWYLNRRSKWKKNRKIQLAQ